MHQEIYRIAYKLSAEGKTPSVALIRSRLTVPTSLPVIVQALQQWKLSPELGKDEPAPNTPNQTLGEAPNLDENAKAIAALALRVEQLEQKNLQLEQQISQLKEQACQ